MANPIKITIEYKDGSTWYTTDANEIRAIGMALPKNIKWAHSAAIDKLRSLYFARVAELTKQTNCGYSKTDLHTSLKPMLMHKFSDYPHYFTTGILEYSTQHLNREGWLALIEQLEVHANDIFGYTFK